MARLQNRDKPILLVVDDTLNSIRLVNETLKNEYRIKVATNGAIALTVAQNTRPDIILLDIVMPVMNGYETCRRLKENEALQDIPVIFLTAKTDEEDEEKGFALGAVDYISKPVSLPILAARLKMHLELKRSRDILKNQNSFLDQEVKRRTKDISIIQEASIMAMATLAEIRDNETGRHLQRVKLYIKKLAEYMGKMDKFKDILTAEKIKLIVQSSPLHDIGKVGIPDRILRKPGPLSKEEFEIIKKHPTLSRDAILCAERLIGGAETFLSCAREIAYSHHEKWNGTGYPQGLSGEDIPLSARLMTVADVYDALTSQRVYKEAVSHEKAIQIIKMDAGKHFDPLVVCAFLAVQESFKHIAKIYAENMEGIGENA